MKNFLKLTISFIVPNVLCCLVSFAFQDFFSDIDILFFGFPILIYLLMQVIAICFFDFSYTKSYYFSLMFLAAWIFIFCISYESKNPFIVDTLGIIGISIFYLPCIIVENWHISFYVGYVMLCILVTLFMVLPMSIKPLYNLRLNKKNQKNQRAE